MYKNLEALIKILDEKNFNKSAVATTYSIYDEASIINGYLSDVVVFSFSAFPNLIRNRAKTHDVINHSV